MKAFFRLITVVCLVLLSTGCDEDFLRIAPQDSATVASVFETEADFEAAIVGVYSNWRVVTVRVPSNLEFRSDNLDGLGSDLLELSTNDLGENIGNVWWDLYRTLVTPANNILSKINGANFSEEAKNIIKGEALFFRAYAYYWMNLAFSGVPLVTDRLSIEESLALGRASEAETWAQVENDLSEAFELLPDMASEKGRVDKYAAAGFLARALLQQQKWSDALPVLQSIYENSGHILEDSWADMWSTETEDSQEYMLVSIGSIEFNHNDYANRFMSDDGGTLLGGLNMDYKPGLVEAFEEGDIRRDMSIGRTPQLNYAENRKYDFGFIGNNWTFDLVALRFSDIVLMYAEAISMAAGSPQQQSLDLINQTRIRSGLASLELTDVPTLDAFVEAILAERRVELLWEGVRFADLKRHNLLIEKLSALGDEYTFPDTYNLLPIPQREIDKYPEGVIVQNPGYN